jgi:uncharacterized membrane protein YfcA
VGCTRKEDVLLVILALALGAVIGAAGGVFGIGGGLIAIPILAVFFGLDQQHAQGTAMVMVVPNVFVGLVQYARRSRMDLRIAATLAACAVPCTYLGAHFATTVPSGPLRQAFAGFLMVIALWYVVRAFRPTVGRGNEHRPRRWGWAAPVGAVGGALSGIFAVGGAVFAVPFLAVMFALTQAAAQGLSLALVAPGTLAGLYAYVRAGDVDWTLGIPLAIGGVLFVSYGVSLAHRLPERFLRALFALLTGASAIALWVRSST